jgi:COP9 signalosome complex subunit 6
MLHDRILLLVKYVTEVIAGQLSNQPCITVYSLLVSGAATKDHVTLRSLSALIASLPASENKEFRKEFDTVGQIYLHSYNGIRD